MIFQCSCNKLEIGFFYDCHMTSTKKKLFFKKIVIKMHNLLLYKYMCKLDISFVDVFEICILNFHSQKGLNIVPSKKLKRCLKGFQKDVYPEFSSY